MPRGASTVDTQTVECERVGVAKGGGTERPGVCAAGSECVRELTLRSGPQVGRGSQAGWLSGPPRIRTRPVLISYRRKHLSGDFLDHPGSGCICSPWSAGRGQAWEEARAPSDCSLLPESRWFTCMMARGLSDVRLLRGLSGPHVVEHSPIPLHRSSPSEQWLCRVRGRGHQTPVRGGPPGS